MTLQGPRREDGGLAQGDESGVEKDTDLRYNLEVKPTGLGEESDVRK